jgi:hypothetical protein
MYRTGMSKANKGLNFFPIYGTGTEADKEISKSRKRLFSGNLFHGSILVLGLSSNLG